MKYLCKQVLSGVSGLILSVTSFELFASPAAQSKLTPAQNLVPVLFALGGVLLLIFILATVIKKFSNFNLVSRNIKLIESQNLGTKEKLIIVEIQDKQLVLGVTPHNINTICELEQPIKKDEKKLNFENMMKQFLNPAETLKAAKQKQKNQNRIAEEHGVKS